MIGLSKNLKDEILFSSKGKTTFHKTIIYDRTSLKCSMIMKQQVTLVNLKHITPCNNTTGGLDCTHTLKIMYMAVDLVNNSKLTDRHLDLLTSLLKELNPHDPSQTAPWISLQTCHLSMVLTLFWSWQTKDLLRG